MTRIVLRGMTGVFEDTTWESSGLLRVGRAVGIEAVLDDSSVSRSHAEIRWAERGWQVRDLGSTNGTRLNGERLGDWPWPLRAGDVVQFGEVALRVVLLATPSPIVPMPLEVFTACKDESISPRKLRLFASACFRSGWQALPPEATRQIERNLDGLANEMGWLTDLEPQSFPPRQMLEHAAAFRAVGVAERYVDGLASEGELESARRRMGQIDDPHATRPGLRAPYPIDMAHAACAPHPIHSICGTRLVFEMWDRHDANYAVPEFTVDPIPWRAEYMRILEEMVGPFPIRSLVVAPNWLASNDGVVGRMAQAIYEARSFDDMPILGDALEDCGCTEQAILRHCREPGKHWRGCWVLDLLTGRE